jgi:DNA-binding NarL/FixJ family response regulator
MTRILCVDDHPVVLDGLSAIIAMQPDMEIAATASTGESALRAFREHKPDVTIVDLRLPDISGLELIKTVRGSDSRAKIIVLSSYDGDADIQRVLDAGAQGYVAKGLVRDELLKAIRIVAKGGKHIPAAIAQRLVDHISDDAISER